MWSERRKRTLLPTGPVVESWGQEVDTLEVRTTRLSHPEGRPHHPRDHYRIPSGSLRQRRDEEVVAVRVGGWEGMSR